MALVSGDWIWEAEYILQAVSHPAEQKIVNPTVLFHFSGGDLLLRQIRTFFKLDTKAIEPFVVKYIKGIYSYRVFFKSVDNPKGHRWVIAVHAS